MNKKNALFAFVLVFSGLAMGQTLPLNVQKTSGTNAITGDLVVPTGRSLTTSGTGTISASALPTGTAPTTGSAGSVAFDTNAWASGRGAIQVNDGTANTYVVAALASDTPTNGQVPTWNTGGTIDWQTPSGGGGTPGGSNTQVQYNNSSAFGGISGATSDGTNLTLGSDNLRATSPRVTGAINDSAGKNVFSITATGSAVNAFTVANAATGSNPSISASGSDTNVGITLIPKGSGHVIIYNSASDSNFTINSVSNGPFLRMQRGGTTKALFGVSGGADNVITGSVADDFCVREDASANILFSTDGGTSIAGKFVASTGQLALPKNITSTSTTTGTMVVTGGVGVSGAVYVGGTLNPHQTSGIVGTTTNNNANAGSFGEYSESLVASGSAVSLTTATAANVTSISLTAGDWDVSGNVNFSAASATVTGTSGGISSTSATLPTDGSEVFSGVQVTLVSETDSVTMQPKRFSLSGTTTVYLVAKSTFSAGTVAAYGKISARRMR